MHGGLAGHVPGQARPSLRHGNDLIEESEKAGSQTQLELPVLCHWATTARQPPDLTIHRLGLTPSNWQPFHFPLFIFLPHNILIYFQCEARCSEHWNNLARQDSTSILKPVCQSLVVLQVKVSMAIYMYLTSLILPGHKFHPGLVWIYIINIYTAQRSGNKAIHMWAVRKHLHPLLCLQPSWQMAPPRFSPPSF